MYRRSALLVCVVIILGNVFATAAFADIIIAATESCRTEGATKADENRHDSSKLSIRASSNGGKAWVKFELVDLDVGKLESAVLTVSLHEGKDGDQSFDVSYVNDDCLDNIDWDDRSITWNNAPGNDTADLGLLDPAKTTYLSTVNFTDGFAGDSFTIDVLEALQNDTDGIVQVVLHNSPNLINLSTHDHAVEEQRPFIDATYKPQQAHAPKPEDNEIGVSVVNTILSWKAGLDPDNPDLPNPNIVEHYLWISVPFDAANPVIPTNPWDAPGTQQFTIAADTDPADGNVDPNVSKVISGLQKDKLYLWVVDEGLVGSSGPLEPDPAKIIWGDIWRFETETTGPAVDAGESTVTWLKEDGTTTVDLNGIVTDDTGDVSVIQWSVLSPAEATVGIANPAVAATTATLTETGTYMLQLYARDATMQEDSDIIEINVYNDSCEAAKNSPDGYTAPEFDFNDDCKVDFLDLALFVAGWLDDASLISDFRYDAGELVAP